MCRQLPRPAHADALAEGGACTPVRRVGLTRSKPACGAGPDTSGNLIVGVLHFIPGGHRGAERRVASRSLRRTRLRGRVTATHPCRETHRGLVGTPTLADCLWPVMDSQVFVAVGCKGSHALLPSLLARFARSLKTGTPRDRLVERAAPTPLVGSAKHGSPLRIKVVYASRSPRRVAVANVRFHTPTPHRIKPGESTPEDTEQSPPAERCACNPPVTIVECGPKPHCGGTPMTSVTGSLLRAFVSQCLNHVRKRVQSKIGPLGGRVSNSVRESIP